MNKFSSFLNFLPYLISRKLNLFFELVGNFENIFHNSKKKIYKPIFICGLARSGSTALLNALNKNSQTGSFLYKDLPFFKTLIFWNLLSNIYYKGVGPMKDTMVMEF